MNMIDLVRKNIKELKPYSAARYTESAESYEYLDANENPFGEWNRYPDPLQKKLKKKISGFKNICDSKIFLGNGSDEIIDLVIRTFCEPGVDAILSPEPGYGIYKTYSQINNVSYIPVLLNGDFSLNVNTIKQGITPNTKLIFLCSPNNPTGNCIPLSAIKSVLEIFKGIVFVDEAYIDFAEAKSAIELIDEYPNLIVSQTFSKAWGLAGLRLGMAFAQKEMVDILNKVKPPYNVDDFTQMYASKVIDEYDIVKEQIKYLNNQKNWLINELNNLSIISKVYPSDANFILIKTEFYRDMMIYLKENNIIIRDRSTQALCEQCVRITVGSQTQNKLLINLLKNFKSN